MIARCTVVVVSFLCCQAIGFADDDPNAAIAEQWRAIPVPEQTPFDEDAGLRAGYLHGYRDGYSWALGQHVACPTNPADHNLHVIRGWVEGWQAGVAAGGTADLPAKYASDLRWGGPTKLGKSGDSSRQTLADIGPAARDWNVIRAGRIEAHDRDQAARLAGNWRMTLPAGFTHDTSIAQRADGLLVLDCRTKINLLGVYAVSDGQMRLVEPIRDGMRDMVWDHRDGPLVLISEEHSHGANYLGATLERIAASAD